MSTFRSLNVKRAYDSMLGKSPDLHQTVAKHLEPLTSVADATLVQRTTAVLDVARPAESWTTDDVATCNDASKACDSGFRKRLWMVLAGIIKTAIVANETVQSLDIDFRTL